MLLDGVTFRWMTEAVADAAWALAEDDFDYHGFLDRERALQQLLPPDRRVDGQCL